MRGRRVAIKPNTSEWLAWRAAGITATDSAVILGLSPWDSPYNLWHRKIADREAARCGALIDEFEPSQRFAIGHALEPTLERFYRAEHMPEGWRVGSGGCWQGRGPKSWLRATPDRIAYAPSQPRTPARLVEFKTSANAQDWGEDDGSGTPDIPVYYRVQVIHQCLVVGAFEATLTVLTGDMRIRHYEIRPMLEELLLIEDAAREFEVSLQLREPPDIDGHAATTARVKRTFGDVEDVAVEIPYSLAEQYRSATSARKALEEREAMLKNRVLAAIGDGRRAITPDGVRVASRSVAYRTSLDAAALRRDHPELVAKYTVTADAPTVTLRETPVPKPKPKEDTRK